MFLAGDEDDAAIKLYLIPLGDQISIGQGGGNWPRVAVGGK